MTETMTNTPTPKTVFEWIDGEPALQTLVQRLYDLMELEPCYAALRERLNHSFFQTADWMCTR